MEFEWDEEKNVSNLKKHGIDFEAATEIFDAPLVRKIDDRKDYGETRWIALGTLRGVCVVVVVYTERLKVRIISIRKANREETKTYKNKFPEA